MCEGVVEFSERSWYGHLKYRNATLWKVILISWGIAFFEYCFQVRAKRIGSYEFTTAQLKTIQEIITLTVFSLFSVLYLGDKFKWNYDAGFACIVAGSFFIFHKWLTVALAVTTSFLEATRRHLAGAKNARVVVTPD
jgi:uncharacterized protein